MTSLFGDRHGSLATLVESVPESGRATQATSASDELSLLCDVTRELAAQEPLRLRLETALQALHRGLAARCSLVGTTKADPASFEVRAAAGLPARAFRVRYGAGIIGRVAETGRAVVVSNLKRDPVAMSELPELLPAPDDLMSVACVPLTIGGETAGALAAYFGAGQSEVLRSRLELLELIAALIVRALGAGARTERAPADNFVACDAAPELDSANMIGDSQAMREIYQQISRVARTNATVLIRGESGTGKELVAEALHAGSRRAAQPFVRVNCAALPESLFESELFGHERGAFTGAHARRKGRFELAQGGTLFLDEIGELPLTTQVKLLRALQFREFERVGGTETLRADVRLVAATNRDLERAVKAGSLREDLYYRLNVFTITLPALRDRPRDIPALSEHFLAKYANEHRRRASRFSNDALDLLRSYAWPGNVRELENVVERAVVVCDGLVIQERHLPDQVRCAAERVRPPSKLADAVSELERSMIEEALRTAQGNAARAARELGTTERVVRYKAQKYSLAGARPRTSSGS